MIQLKIREKIEETPGVATLVLEPLSGSLTYQAGQFLTLIFNWDGQKPFRRSYSFSSTPGIDPYPSITVKRTINGQASSYLVAEAAVGDILEAIKPAGQFVLPAYHQPRDIFLFGGGSGITPLFSILKWVLKNEPNSKVHLIQADSRPESVIFREDLQKLSDQYSHQFNYIQLLSRLGLKQNNRSQWINSRLSNAMVEEFIKKHLSFDPKNAQFFICGPAGLMLKSEQCIRFMGFEETQIHQEIFVVKPNRRPPAESFPNSLVKINFNQQQYLVNLQAGQTILEAAEAAGIDLPYSCRSGICTACSGQCISGEVQMHTQLGLMNTKTTKGLVMTCTGYPVTEEVEIIVG